MISLPSRQIHLDFHTSEHITAVGSKFSKQQFQRALKIGHVNSVTVFAKCHHSWSYYPTKVGLKHPTLKTDLLGKQIEACHAIGVRAPIYYTVGWSANDAETHPEWCARNRDGSIMTMLYDLNAKPTDKKPTFSWKFLCPSGEYEQLILDQTRELCERYPVDGFFYDICAFGATCFCERCRRGMKEAGLDDADDAQTRTYHVRLWVEFMRRCNAIIRPAHPDATVFFNGALNMDSPAEYRPQQTHYELEDLPTTWGGYDKFPLRAKAMTRDGKALLAMSGKFHTAWGEFGGFKHPDAIRFEAAAMIAFGARCSFGDQLHPSGEMDLETYRSIGVAYKYVKRIESFGLDGHPYATAGLVLCHQTPHDQGVANILLENQIDFDVVPLDAAADLSHYETLILSGGRFLNESLAKRVNDFVAGGGSLLVLGEGALELKSDRVLIDIGASYAGPASFDVDYLVAGKELGREMVKSPFLNYTPAGRYKAKRGTRVLARIREPYFSRTYEGYCSHQNTPYSEKDAAQGGAFQCGRVILLPHALGAMYHEWGARLHRQFVVNALRRVHRKPVLSVDGMPSGGRINLIHQPARRRYVAHLLYGPPVQRGKCSVIEDLVPLRRVGVGLRVPEKIRRVALPLHPRMLRPIRSGNRVTVELPEFAAHEIIAFDY